MTKLLYEDMKSELFYNTIDKIFILIIGNRKIIINEYGKILHNIIIKWNLKENI